MNQTLDKAKYLMGFKKNEILKLPYKKQENQEKNFKWNKDQIHELPASISYKDQLKSSSFDQETQKDQNFITSLKITKKGYKKKVAIFCWKN